VTRAQSLIDSGETRELAAAIAAEIKRLPAASTASLRAIRRRYSRSLRPASAELVLGLARELCMGDAYRWFAYELIQNHPAGFNGVDARELECLGRGLNSWWTVDAFARILSGPAWLTRQIPDTLILKWARSKDRWWRRAALVSTVALNVRSQGGTGDVSRTLRVCHLLAGDRDEMVAKALSWALRALVVHDGKAVQRFLAEDDPVLPGLVKREVKNKLETGLKNPRR
jgi:3-methyladenine DNA glycosylase AlkD